MKQFMNILIATLVCGISAGRLNSNYLPPPSATQINSAFTSNNHHLDRATPPPPAIIKQNNQNNGDGYYSFGFETENRITQQEIGELKNAGTDQESNVIQGSYSYTGPDGVVYTVNYIADENGFRASGDHLPTSAPVPAEILEAVQQNQADEAAGVVDDGQYKLEQNGTPVGAQQVQLKTGQKNGYRY